jgi:saccharopine dehydrogenase-like NADP-dependent oxidoreductase
MMGFRAGIVAVMLAFSGMAVAEKETQMIANISGQISIDETGNVKKVTLDNIRNDKFEKFYVDNIMTWEFFPMEVNGKPVQVSTGFNVNLIATFLADKSLKQLEFKDVYIEPTLLEIELKKKNGFKKGRMGNINYPWEAIRLNAGANVVLALDVGADGNVKKAEVFRLELLNADAKDSKVLEKTFVKNAMEVLRKKKFSKDELAYNSCLSGCIVTFTVNFITPDSNVWQSFVRVPVAPIPWLIAAELKDLDDVQKSQLVRLKEDPTGKPIDSNG